MVGGLDHAPLATIVEEIVELGVNSVRLPWANETLEHNPVVPDYAVKANPQFKGKHAMEVMDAVIARAGQGAHHGDPRQPHEQCGLVLQRDRWQWPLV